mgnify:CR=1 FL=1
MGTAEPAGFFRVGLLGHGTVGAAFARLLGERSDAIEAEVGRRPEISGVLTRSRGDFGDILEGSDLIVELMGGIDPAREYVLRAMEGGRHVVTANKQLLSRHGEEIFDAARAGGVQLRFEGAVAGVVPAIRVMAETLAALRDGVPPALLPVKLTSLPVNPVTDSEKNVRPCSVGAAGCVSEDPSDEDRRRLRALEDHRREVRLDHGDDVDPLGPPRRQVEQRAASDDAARDRRHGLGQRQRLEAALLGDAPKRELEGDVAPGDRRAAGAAVGLEHVAVDPHRALAEGGEVHHAAQRAADEALDLDRPPVWTPLRDVTPLTLAGGGRQHSVLGRHPAATLSRHPPGNLVLDRGGADNPSPTGLDERGAGRRPYVPGLYPDLAKVAGSAAVGASTAHRHLVGAELAHRGIVSTGLAHAAALPRPVVGAATSTCSTSPIGS